MKNCLPTIGGIAVFAFFGVQPALAGCHLIWCLRPVRALFVAGLRDTLAQSRPCVAEDRFFHIWPVK